MIIVIIICYLLDKVRRKPLNIGKQKRQYLERISLYCVIKTFPNNRNRYEW